MGGRSAKMQKQVFPRTITKAKKYQNIITGTPNEYPSIKASSQSVMVSLVIYNLIIREGKSYLLKKVETFRPSIPFPGRGLGLQLLVYSVITFSYHSNFRLIRSRLQTTLRSYGMSVGT